MPEYVVGELYAEALERIDELERAIAAHMDAHMNNDGTFLVSHVADLALWTQVQGRNDW